LKHPRPTVLAAALSATLLTTLSLGLLSACGGGSSSSDATKTAASVRLNTYITDNLSTAYSQVWVGLKRITALDSSGVEQTLYSSTEAVGYSSYDLRSLASVGELMSAASIPAGVYSQIQVTLAPDVKLVQASDGAVINAKFTSDDSDKVVRVGVALDTATSTTLVLDFNLEKFSYSPSTHLVTPDVSRKDSGALKDFKYHQGKVQGTVLSVDTTARTLTVNDTRLGSSTVLSLSSDAVITQASDGAVVALADLAVGTAVRAVGTVTSASTDSSVTVSVSAVTIESNSSAVIAANRYRGEGTVSALSGSTVTLSLTDANFLPTSATITLDVASARYVHGQLSDLSVGGSLRFQASYDSTTQTYTAALVDVAGAVSARVRASEGNSPGSSANRPTAVQGSITAISGTSWTVGSYTVDVSSAYIKGASACLVVGSTIEARGALSGTTLVARTVKVQGCTNSPTTSTS
jgi:hypothetical protein